MKILHVTPHLGGGVGKAHAAIAAALPKNVEQTFLLLEQPIDRRYPEALTGIGARVIVADDLTQVAAEAAAADVVQFEYWNHPRLFECLARCEFPALRSLFWAHQSGLFRPLIPPRLIAQAGRFVFTSEASRAIPLLGAMPEHAESTIDVINSGFGFPKPCPHGGAPLIAYLGTVDFVKMHPGFFDAVDALTGSGIEVSVWGQYDADGEVAARARAMRHPERVIFCDQTAGPISALSRADIFFYPLQPDHYGTSENALIEAMSLGLVPVVLNNPAEMAIVTDGETGLVAGSIEECTVALQRLLTSPDLRARLSRNAVAHVAATRTPARSARKFTDLWQSLSAESARVPDFRSCIGSSPADWFLATQCLPGSTVDNMIWPTPENLSKGTLTHFQKTFAGDASLSRLRA
jgi:glycosyltransferase involved in cell wall biosynthesis